MTSDRILGAVCVGAAAAMGWAARGYVAPIAYEPVGPRAFPMLLAALIAMAGAWLVIRPSAHSAAVSAGRTRALLGCAAAVVVYALLFQALGFIVATALMTLPVGRAFGGRWLPALAGGLGLGIALFVLFDTVLDVVLPTGMLSVVLGGH